MRALVVGADGFAGRWLVRHLHESGDDVAALVGPRFQPPLEGATAITPIDVREYEPMATTIADARPEAVYYLAAVSAAGGRERIADAARIGLVGAIHALTACAEQGAATRFLFVSSAHVYGDPGRAPVRESSDAHPSSVYGAAKLAAEAAVLELAAVTRVEVVVGRAFNHVGHGQASAFVVPSLIRQFQSIPPGGQGTVHVGRRDSVRDFTDVRDVARAYRILATKGERGSRYNIASGVGTSIEDLVRLLAEIVGATVSLNDDGRPARTGDPSVLIGDSSRLRQLGWRPTIELRTTLREMLELGGADGPINE